MTDYAECLIKINQGLDAYRKAILQNKTFEAFVIAEDLKTCVNGSKVGRTKRSSVATKAEKKHYDKIAQLGCCLCRHLDLGETPCEIHHIRHAGRRDLAPVIGLCPEHHRGNTGVHGLGRKAFNRTYGLTEEDLLLTYESK